MSERPPHTDLVALRQWLLADRANVLAYVDDRLRPAQVIQEYPEIATSTATLRNMRHEDRGPMWVNGNTGIRYPRVGLIAYLEERTVRPGRLRAVRSIRKKTA